MSSFYLITNWLHSAVCKTFKADRRVLIFTFFTAYIDSGKAGVFVFTAAAKLRYRTREIDGINTFGDNRAVEGTKVRAAALKVKLAEGFAFVAENRRFFRTG